MLRRIKPDTPEFHCINNEENHLIGVRMVKPFNIKYEPEDLDYPIYAGINIFIMHDHKKQWHVYSKVTFEEEGYRKIKYYDVFSYVDMEDYSLMMETVQDAKDIINDWVATYFLQYRKEPDWDRYVHFRNEQEKLDFRNDVTCNDYE